MTETDPAKTAVDPATGKKRPWYETAATLLFAVSAVLYLLASGRSASREAASAEKPEPRETAPGHLEDPPGPLPSPHIPTPTPR